MMKTSKFMLKPEGNDFYGMDGQGNEMKHHPLMLIDFIPKDHYNIENINDTMCRRHGHFLNL